MIHTEEDDEFERILRENKLKGQAYDFNPQRIWTGLTDEEISQFDVDPLEAKQLIAKLKEKNNG
jgi:hypothetical protein